MTAWCVCVFPPAASIFWGCSKASRRGAAVARVMRSVRSGTVYYTGAQTLSLFDVATALRPLSNLDRPLSCLCSLSERAYTSPLAESVDEENRTPAPALDPPRRAPRTPRLVLGGISRSHAQLGSDGGGGCRMEEGGTGRGGASVVVVGGGGSAGARCLLRRPFAPLAAMGWPQRPLPAAGRSIRLSQRRKRRRRRACRRRSAPPARAGPAASHGRKDGGGGGGGGRRAAPRSSSRSSSSRRRGRPGGRCC